MEDIFFFFLVILSLLNIDIKGVNYFHNDYMDLKSTNPIRGVFVWMIFLKHYYTYFKNRNYLYIKILRYLGQKIVSLFLFYSGYGIFESIKSKGTSYVKSLPKKAIILFVKFQIIIFFFFLCNIILGIKVTIRKYLLSMIFKSSIGNSNWFAFTIITFYLYTYLCFIFIKKKRLFLGVIYLNITIIIHIYLVFIYILISLISSYKKEIIILLLLMFVWFSLVSLVYSSSSQNSFNR